MKQRFSTGVPDGWKVTVRPKAGEAVMVACQRPRAERAPKGDGDPERARLEAERRARQSIRRTVAEFCLTRMVTLTYAESRGPESRPVVVAELEAFVRKLRRELRGLVWVAVLEWHPSGHGWHIHVLVNRFVPKARWAELWGHGFVDVRLIKAKGNTSSRKATLKAANYAAKYIGKDRPEGAPERKSGEHRYHRPHGLVFEVIRSEGSPEELRAIIAHFLPSISWTWASWECEDWRGPQCVVFRE